MSERIVYVANTRLPSRRAKANQVVNMANALEGIGHDVELVYPRRKQPEGGPDERLETYFGNIDFEPTELWCLDFLYAADRLPTPLVKMVFYIQSLTFALASVYYLRSVESDIVYSRAKIFTAIVTVLGQSVFHEIHRGPNRFDTFLMPAYSRLCGIVAISEGLREEWCSSIDVPILVAHDGVNWEQFAEGSRQEARRELGFPEDSDIVCYAGSLKPWKGVPTLLKAANRLQSDALVLIVGGTDSQRSEIRDLVSEIDSNVSLVGHVPPHKVSQYLHAADVLILPNTAEWDISARFTSPLKLFEYMAVGKPIVASDLPSVREILTDDMAHFTKPDDPDSLADGIDFVLSNPEYARPLARMANAEGEQYSWTRRASRIVEFMNEQGPERCD